MAYVERIFTNNSYATLADALGSTDTTCTIVEEPGRPLPAPASGQEARATLVLLDPDTGAETGWEVFSYTALAGGVISGMTRRVEGSQTPIEFPAGSVVECRTTATTLAESVGTTPSANTLNIVSDSPNYTDTGTLGYDAATSGVKLALVGGGFLLIDGKDIELGGDGMVRLSSQTNPILKSLSGSGTTGFSQVWASPDGTLYRHNRPGLLNQQEATDSTITDMGNGTVAQPAVQIGTNLFFTGLSLGVSDYVYMNANLYVENKSATDGGWIRFHWRKTGNITENPTNNDIALIYVPPGWSGMRPVCVSGYPAISAGSLDELSLWGNIESGTGDFGVNIRGDLQTSVLYGGESAGDM